MTSERVDAFVQDLMASAPEQAELVSRLRRLVLGLDPRITEDVRYGGILFSASSPFCGVFAYTRHVSLEFSRGAALPDVHHALEGEGAQRRHIKLLRGDDLFVKNVRHYLTEALARASAPKASRQRAKRTG